MKLSGQMTAEDAAENVRSSILVVEDEILIRMLVAEGLRAAGYRVVEACSADEALVILQSAAFDLVISDVRMPGSLDGMGLLATIRQRSTQLPVIITSGHLQPSLATADGATQFISKPFTIETVLDAVQTELGTAL